MKLEVEMADRKNTYVFRYAYDAQGRVVSMRPDQGVGMSFAYDATGNLTRILSEQGTSAVVFCASCGTQREPGDVFCAQCGASDEKRRVL